MRVLLATEGSGYEVVAQHVIKQYLTQVEIKLITFPKRGLDEIRRMVSDCIKMGYSGSYDMLVVHFDLDDTLPDGFIRADQSKRWHDDIKTRIDMTLADLTGAQRRDELKIVLTPRRAMEAWLSWGRNNKSGRVWEGGETGTLKRQLFGSPPRRVPEKTELYTRDLIAQMHRSDDWPVTLRWFVLDVHGVGSVIKEFAMGVNGKRPEAEVVDVAARVVQVAVAYTDGPDFAVDDEDGDLDIHLRLTNGLLVMANLFPDGTIDASVYDDSQGIPVKTVKRMRRSTTSPEELISFFEQGGCAGTE